MNITTDKPVMVFLTIKNDKNFYSIGLSKQEQDKTYTNAYFPCYFRKGIELANKTKINIKKSWISFYKKKDGKNEFYIFIDDFEVIEENNSEKQIEIEVPNVKSNYQNDNIELTDEDLPF